ncbi:glycosyltransferase [Natrinema altunense]|uniref:glycosyltransferase n=1 Tax=Natrinema altunense TaxID=222984 RepID=UPI001A910255|nr:glycosyltransferase [Natrinema altunense]
MIDYTWNSYLPILGPIRSIDNPDVIHIHWLDALIIGPTVPRTVFKGFRLVFELLIVRLLGIQVVWTVHNLTAHDSAYPQWEVFWRSIASRYFFSNLIVHCKVAKELVREKYHLGPSTQISVIPHGNYISEYNNIPDEMSARKELGIEPDARVFMFFGQIKPYKQVPYLIESFKNIDYENTTLIIAGNPSSKSLQSQIDRQSENHDDIRTRLEFIPEEDVAKYFTVADIVVLPYRNILTSGSAILAMSFARPTIVPQIGCLPELINNNVNGFLYDPDDPNSLEQTMSSALEADLAEIGKNGYETVEKLKWSEIANKTIRAYE